MQGLLGKKLGMTQIYDDKGRMVSVTVIALGPCVITQCKTLHKDGYDAVQLAFEEIAKHRANKPILGHFKKVKTLPRRYLREFSVEDGDLISPGDTLTTKIFEGISYVDVAAVSKGRGFQGVVKRHDMAGGRKTHGGGGTRRVGAIGQCAYPARVARGRAMPGHMGNRRVTTQNLRVVSLDLDKNLMLVNGAIPGPAGGIVEVRKALKKEGKET